MAISPITITKLDRDRCTRILLPNRSPMRPHSGAHSAATSGVTPSVTPVHAATVPTSVSPSAWKWSARNGITSVKPVKPTNEATIKAAWLRCQEVVAARDACAAPAMLRLTGLLKPDLDGAFRLGGHVDAVDETHPPRMRLHHQRHGPGAVAEEAHALHQRAVGDAGRGEDDVLARGEIPRLVDPLEVGDAHGAATGFVFGRVYSKPREDLAAQAAHRRCRQHALGRAARAHHRVHTAADYRGGDAG